MDITVYDGGAAEGRWHVGVPRSSTMPVDGSGPSRHVVITLTDAAGWTSVQEHDVIIDTLAGDVAPTFIGADGVSFVRPAQDGIAGYYFGATHGSTFTLDMLLFTADDLATKTVSLQAAAASFDQAQDGFVSYGHLVVEDSLGNLSIYHSPISYTDNALTPDYVGMHEAAGLQAVVQWQSGDGVWHDVYGWCSELSGEPVIWWTAPGDFGKGPFRWAAYAVNGAEPRFVSEAFRLLNNHEDRTIVTLK